MFSDHESQKYPHLEYIFSGCFHSEWKEVHKTKEDVIVDYAKHREINELLDILLEIEELKKEFPDDETLKCVIEDDLGLGYGLGIYLIGMTAVEWLDFVASIIKRELNNRKSKT